MRTHASKLKPALLLSTAMLALSGCVVAPPATPVYSDPGYPVDGVYAPAPPPTPYAETVPMAPYPGAVWIGGYWNWSGGRHVWVPGRYERARPGFRYQQRRWVPAGRGRWELHGGGWIR